MTFFKLYNVKSGSGGNIAFLTFDLNWYGKINGNPTDAKAMETYIFRKEGGKWKDAGKKRSDDGRKRILTGQPAKPTHNIHRQKRLDELR